MAYTVLATRYRPRQFADVVGQQDAARVLLAAVTGERTAHAYLFSGPRGVGKTSMARILAKAWDCLAGETGTPCGTCSVCRAIDEGGDCLDVVEIDGASHNRVENVRELIDTIRFRPVEARYRIYIVDEVHMLSTSAFNALLKTLEEPPAHARFILATTEPLKVPETIRSRCQHIDFRRLSGAEITARLEEICRREQVEVPDGLLARVARHARGGLRDALSLLDQLITFGDGRPTLADFERLTGRLAPESLHELLECALAGDAAGTLAAGQAALRRGARAADLLEQLQELLSGVLVAATGAAPAELTPEERGACEALAAKSGVDRVVAMLDVLVEAVARLRQRHDEQLVIDMAMVTLARLPWLRDIAALLAQGGAPADAQAVAPAPARSATAPAVARPDPARSASTPSAGTTAAGSGTTRPAAAERVAPPGDADFASRLLEDLARGARSLRADLARYRAIRLQGDELLLVLPENGPGALFDPRDPDIRRRLLDAAARVAGRPIALRVLEQDPDAPPAATGPRAARPVAEPPARPTGALPGPTGTAAAGETAAGGTNRPLDARIRGDWPGAEKLD